VASTPSSGLANPPAIKNMEKNRALAVRKAISFSMWGWLIKVSPLSKRAQEDM
jgi:hypothetical protein